MRHTTSGVAAAHSDWRGSTLALPRTVGQFAGVGAAAAVVHCEATWRTRSRRRRR